MSMYKKYIGASDEEVIEMVKTDFGPIASEYLKHHGYLSLKQAKEYAEMCDKKYFIRDWDENVGFMLMGTEASDDLPDFNTKDWTQR